MAKPIYQGNLLVAGEDYVHEFVQGDDYVESEIEDLDVYVTRKHELRFVLQYPFQRPYQGVVIGDGGVTLRAIIDAVRRGYHVMYRAAHHKEIPNLANQIVDGDYGRAYHSIDDLLIERIELDEATGSLDISIGS